MEVNKEKMRELICYVLKNFENNVNRDLLLKILFFSDFDYYNRYKKSITNETYKKYPNGPIPIHFTEIKDGLLDEGKIMECNNSIFSGSKVELFYCNLDISKTNLATDEIEIVDYCVNRLSKSKDAELNNCSLENDSLWCNTEKYEILEYKMINGQN